MDFVCFAFSQAFGAVSEGIPGAKLGNTDWMMGCVESHGNWEHVDTTGCAEFGSSWTPCYCSGRDGDTGQVVVAGKSCKQRNF